MENEISPGVKVQVRVRDDAPTKQTPAPQGAAPFRGSPQCVHWGKGSPEQRYEKNGKESVHDNSRP